MIQLVLILDNIRSTHNVGSILRTCDAAGVAGVICCGTTPYPRLPNDDRDPVVINRNTREIAKTALGAETTIRIEYISDTANAVRVCKSENRSIYALEQTPNSSNLLTTELRTPAALIVGSETLGVQKAVLDACDEVLELPQYGSKESLNVAVATGIAIYKFLSP